ncbi:2Fe-2S iron-sulfur cluster binding domain-containing protein [Endozoicomonas sp. SCSIO W0465]|uniref:2Fe-2S iron-sulfur cluster-binding protein n=1 Tax=Endozoicomonas sp. SCSIO W0465 TaxID=2918516 RepID=UPI002075718D|nr:2Fe-2S iron-sulfur cluster binding domain-containing protein [Endozoicomonas sp. SCSIO W0465]USE33844.1 2Fe-2S iron-sulfur cluster binding domain-containing protein [Endozoicomonas sp. SCSIO W0465]
MPEIQFQGSSYSLDENENLLDGLLRQHARAPYSCRAGVCHSCMLRVTAGSVPAEAQSLLTPEQVKKGYILACQTRITEDLSLTLPTRDEVPGILTELKTISSTEVSIKVSTRLPFDVSIGEYITLVSDERLEASYPVTGCSEDLQTLACSITRSAGGSPFSAWIHSRARTGDHLIVIKKG